MCDYETVESVNEKLFNNLSELVKMPFFKYFQVRDIFKVDICHVIKTASGGLVSRVSILAR